MKVDIDLPPKKNPKQKKPTKQPTEIQQSKTNKASKQTNPKNHTHIKKNQTKTTSKQQPKKSGLPVIRIIPNLIVANPSRQLIPTHPHDHSPTVGQGSEQEGLKNKISWTEGKQIQQVKQKLHKQRKFRILSLLPSSGRS